MTAATCCTVVLPAIILVAGDGLNVGWGLGGVAAALPVLLGAALIAAGFALWLWTVRLFARLRDIAGGGEFARDIPPGATIGAVWRELAGEYPDLGPYERSISSALRDPPSVTDVDLSRFDARTVVAQLEALPSRWRPAEQR